MRKILAILLAGTMMFSFAACGGSSNDGNISSSTVETKATIDEYIEKCKSSFEDVKKQFEGVMDVEVYSENGDTVVCQYTYLQDMGDLTDSTEALEKTLDQSTTNFLKLIEEIKDFTGISNPKICVKYCNVDDTVIFEKTYDENSEVPKDATDISSEINSDNKYDSMEAFVKSGVLKASIDSAAKQFEGVLEVDILAEGNSLVYQYKYIEQIPEESIDILKSSFEETINSDDASLDYIVEMVETLVEVENPTVIFRILNADDSLIYEEEV